MELLLIFVALLLVALLLVLIIGGVFIYLKWQESKKEIPKIKDESIEDVLKSMYNLDDEKEKRRYQQLMRAWYWNGELNEDEED